MTERFYAISCVLAVGSACIDVLAYAIPLATEPFYFALGIAVLWRVMVLCLLAVGVSVALPTCDTPWERRARLALVVMLGATALGVSYTTPGLSDPSEDGIWLAMSALLIAAGAARIEIKSRMVAAILGMAIYTVPLSLMAALFVGTTSAPVRVAILLGLQALVIHVVLAWKRDREIR
jgi:hypothetical protein